jgi:hypothetical protein
MADNQQDKRVPTQPKKEVYSLMWRTYDLTGKTRAQFIKEHPYSVNPAKSISREFMIFHLGEAYFFMNEII